MSVPAADLEAGSAAGSIAAAVVNKK